MAYQTVFADRTTAVNLGSADRVFVKSNVALVVSGATAISGVGSNHTAVVHGDVAADGDGIHLGDTADIDSRQSVVVGADGFVRGEDDGVEAVGSMSRIDNGGTISGQNSGISLNSDDDSESSIVNRGLIASSVDAIKIAGIGQTIFYNYGTVSGGEYAYRSTEEDTFDLVVNKGEIVGDVDLGGGDDVYRGQSGHVVGNVDGGAGADVIRMSAEDDFVAGSAGDDSLFGYAGDDVMLGGVDNDTLRGGDGDDLLAGGVGSSEADGDDVLMGGDGADTMIGGGGSDRYFVNDLGDVVVEGEADGVDTVESSVGFRLYGTFAENLVLTGSAASFAVGNALANTIVGNASDNLIYGQEGDDLLTGGAGLDSFFFDRALNAQTNVDTIVDFRASDDSLRLSKSIFGAASSSAAVLTAGEFAANTTGRATQRDDRIIYETDTGKLFYDADGSGSGAAVQFALLLNKASISYLDILIF